VLRICAGAPFEVSQPYNAHDGNNCRAIPRYITGATGFAYVPKDRESLAKSVFVNPTVIAVDATRWNTFAAGERRHEEPDAHVSMGQLSMLLLLSLF
jgi:hypothetical protein